MPSRERKIEIEKAVVELLEDLGINRYPISVQRITEGLGVSLVPYSKLTDAERVLAKAASKDAFQVRTADFSKAMIAVDDRGSNFYRSRFSGAHEIGHIWLEHDEDTPDREGEADYFAGYLLAPHPLVLAAPAGTSISEVFGVSGQCASFAYDQAQNRRRSGMPWARHERWLLDNVVWGGGGLVGRP